jgi:hypothetical protein
VPPAGPPVAQALSGRRRARRERSGLAAFLRNNVVLLIVTTVVLGVGGVALATGKPSRPSVALTSAPAMSVDSPTAPAAGSSAGSGAGSTGSGASAGAVAPVLPAPPAGALAARLFRLGHGQTSVTSGKGQVTVTFDAGTVSGLTYGAITVTRPDGTMVTVAINGATRFGPSGRHPKVGDRAVVYSSSGTALRIVSAAPSTRAGNNAGAPGV